MEAPRRKDVEDAHEILDKYGKNFVTKVRAQAACESKISVRILLTMDKILILNIDCVIQNDLRFFFQEGNTLLHLYLEKPKVYIYIFASAGVPVNIQNTVSSQVYKAHCSPYKGHNSYLD